MCSCYNSVSSDSVCSLPGAVLCTGVRWRAVACGGVRWCVGACELVLNDRLLGVPSPAQNVVPLWQIGRNHLCAPSFACSFARSLRAFTSRVYSRVHFASPFRVFTRVFICVFIRVFISCSFRLHSRVHFACSFRVCHSRVSLVRVIRASLMFASV